MRGIFKDKENAIKWAKKYNRRVIWLFNGEWHAATNLNNVPYFSDQVEILNIQNGSFKTVEQWNEWAEIYRNK